MDITGEDFEIYLTSIDTDLAEFMDDVFDEKNEDMLTELLWSTEELDNYYIYESLLLVQNITEYDALMTEYTLTIYDLIYVLNEFDVSFETAEEFVSEKLDMSWYEFESYEDVIDELENMFWYATEEEVDSSYIVDEFLYLTNFADFEDLINEYDFSMSEAVDLLNSQGYSYESFISYIEEIGGSEEDVLKIWKNSPNNSDYDEFYNYFWYVTEDDYLEIYYENAFEIEYWQQATMDDLLTLIESYEITMEEFASTFSFWSFEEMENDIEGFFGSDIATLIAAFDSTDETYFESLFEFATLDDSEDAWIKDFMIEATEFSDVEYIYENYAFDIESFVAYLSGDDAVTIEEFYAHFEDNEDIEFTVQDILDLYDVTEDDLEDSFSYDSEDAFYYNFFFAIWYLEDLDEIVAIFETYEADVYDMVASFDYMLVYYDEFLEHIEYDTTFDIEEVYEAFEIEKDDLKDLFMLINEKDYNKAYFAYDAWMVMSLDELVALAGDFDFSSKDVARAWNFIEEDYYSWLMLLEYLSTDMATFLSTMDDSYDEESFMKRIDVMSYFVEDIMSVEDAT